MRTVHALVNFNRSLSKIYWKNQPYDTCTFTELPYFDLAFREVCWLVSNHARGRRCYAWQHLAPTMLQLHGFRRWPLYPIIVLWPARARLQLINRYRWQLHAATPRSNSNSASDRGTTSTPRTTSLASLPPNSASQTFLPLPAVFTAVAQKIHFWPEILCNFYELEECCS